MAALSNFLSAYGVLGFAIFVVGLLAIFAVRRVLKHESKCAVKNESFAVAIAEQTVAVRNLDTGVTTLATVVADTRDRVVSLEGKLAK